jgi:hypothetical protein
MNEAAGERLQMENELRQAISAITPGHSEFSVHFQPQIETAAAASSASKPCCAGTARASGRSRRSASSPSPRKPA